MKPPCAEPEGQTHRFVVKVWIEETAEEASRPAWCGHITHIPSGTRRYFRDLDRLVAFIVPYLRELGVHPRPGRRLRRWLARLRRYPQVSTDTNRYPQINTDRGRGTP